MRNNIIYLVLLFGTIISSCQSSFELKSDMLLTEVFTDNEIVEIQKMIDYVDEMVEEITGENNIERAYHLYFEKMKKLLNDSSKFLVSFDEEEKYTFLESLDSSVINDFWSYWDVKSVNYKGYHYTNIENYKSIGINNLGRYVEYLEKLGQNDEYYRDLSEGIQLAGDLSSSLAFWYPDNHNKFDYNKVSDRLWAVVYILDMEEPIDKKTERYLK